MSQPAVQLIVPGPYKAPISVRAAARFAQVASAPPTVPESLAALRRHTRTRLTVLVLVAAALVAAGAVGTALAFRFGARTPRGGAPPTATVSPP